MTKNLKSNELDRIHGGADDQNSNISAHDVGHANPHSGTEPDKGGGSAAGDPSGPTTPGGGGGNQNFGV